MNNQFKFSKGWAAEMSGNYNTAFEDAQFIIYDLGQVTAGIAKQVLMGKGSLKLNVRDIFFSQTIVGDIRYQNIRGRFRRNRDSRVANISFTWRFGKNCSDNPKEIAAEAMLNKAKLEMVINKIIAVKRERMLYVGRWCSSAF